MSRFDNLEFEEGQAEKAAVPGRAGADEPIRDEHYWLKLADDNWRSGFYENALRFFSRALELDKSLVTGWLGQVKMLIALGEYPEANLWGGKALELFRDNGELLAGRAQALIRLQDRRKANELCDAAMGREGQSSYRWLVRGEIMVSSSASMDRHCFDKAVALDPDWLVPLEIARVYQHYQKPSQAAIWAGQAVTKAPGQAYAWYVKGSCEMELDLAARARQSFTRCRELVPNHQDAGQRLAELANRGWSLKRTLRRLLGM